MVDGVWRVESVQAPTSSSDLAAQFTTPAAQVPVDVTRLAAAPERFHLYAAWVCLFAHRTLLARAMLNLERLPITLADPWLGGPQGWTFPTDVRGPVPGATTLWQIYAASNAHYSGRGTVPVLWYREAGAIVSAESDEILFALPSAFAGRGSIEIATEGASLHVLCDWSKDRINLGVYRIGFSRTQGEYNAAHASLLRALSKLNERLGTARYL